MSIGDGRISSVNKVMFAMEELDHSELTRGNVRAASRALNSMHTELQKEPGMDSGTNSFEKLLGFAEKGNWTELRNARNNGLMPNARDEVNNIFTKIDRHTSQSGAISRTENKSQNKETPIDRGYPPQHTEASERAYLQRRKEAQLEFRDRRSVEPTTTTPWGGDYDRHDLRQRDDPKQVSNTISRLAADRLRDGKSVDLEEISSPKHVAEMFVDLYNREWSTAISRLAADRLRDGKSVDLEDISSPKHVAEMFVDLYNREWSAAYEEMNKTIRDGGETIRQLLSILESAFDYCKKNSERQLSNMFMHVENEMMYPNVSAQSRASLEAQKPPDRKVLATVREGDYFIQDFRKHTATASIPFLKWYFYEDVLKSLQPNRQPTSYQSAYVDRCIELTWMMAIQNPPMYFEFCNKGDRISSYFRPFTKMGSTVQNCVWPALLLHKNGPLMEKGVAHLG